MRWKKSDLTPMGRYSMAYMQSENFTLGLIRGGGGGSYSRVGDKSRMYGSSVLRSLSKVGFNSSLKLTVSLF